MGAQASVSLPMFSGMGSSAHEGLGRKQIANKTTRKSTIPETAMKGFMAITDLWGFSDQEKTTTLGLESPEELQTLASNPSNISKSQLEKVSYIFSIYDDLRTLLGDEECADNWLRHTHKEKFLLAGKTPLQNILSGEAANIKKVCRYLASIRYS